MKMNKKIIGLVLASMLPISVIGCGNDKIEEQPKIQLEQEQQIQEEKNDLQEAKEIVEEIAEENFGKKGFVYEVTINEEANAVMFIVHVSREDVIQMIAEGSWSSVVLSMVDASYSAWQCFNTIGLDVNVSFAMGDIYRDEVYAYDRNGELLYNIEDEINN